MNNGRVHGLLTPGVNMRTAKHWRPDNARFIGRHIRDHCPPRSQWTSIGEKRFFEEWPAAQPFQNRARFDDRTRETMRKPGKIAFPTPPRKFHHLISSPALPSHPCETCAIVMRVNNEAYRSLCRSSLCSCASYPLFIFFSRTFRSYVRLFHFYAAS